MNPEDTPLLAAGYLHSGVNCDGDRDVRPNPSPQCITTCSRAEFFCHTGFLPRLQDGIHSRTRYFEGIAEGFGHPPLQLMSGQVDVGVFETLLLRHDKIVCARKPEYNRLDGETSNDDLGTADQDPGFEPVGRVHNLLGDDLHKEMRLPDHD